jgi:hypothetical protein
MPHLLLAQKGADLIHKRFIFFTALVDIIFTLADLTKILQKKIYFQKMVIR